MNTHPLFNANHLWNPSCTTPIAFFLIAVLSVALLILLPSLIRQYNRFLRAQQFRKMIEPMALERKDTNILWELVQRYALNEPMLIVYSLPLFDDLVQKEMVRVLGHPCPSMAKMQYIDFLYGLRQKMYFEGYQ